MIKRREFIRGAGLVAAGCLPPFRAMAQPYQTRPGPIEGPPPPTGYILATPPANFGSNNNYFMVSGGQPI